MENPIVNYVNFYLYNTRFLYICQYIKTETKYVLTKRKNNFRERYLPAWSVW